MPPVRTCVFRTVARARDAGCSERERGVPPRGSPGAAAAQFRRTLWRSDRIPAGGYSTRIRRWSCRSSTSSAGLRTGTLVWLLGLLALDPVLLELAPERGAADAERLGGAGVVAAEALQRLENMDALGVREADLPGKRRRGTQLEPRRHVRRQVLRTDGVASSQDGRALEGVLQLSHVPWPRVAEEAFESLGRQAEPAAELACRPREEMLGQRGNVLAAVAKGREDDLDDVEAIEEVLAEAPLADQRREVTVGGRDHAHVDGRGLRRAEPPDLAALECAEELYLKNAGHLGDLVQEQRAAVGLFEEAELVDGGAGERTPHVAEELGLEQRLGHRAAVPGHERARRPRGRVVDGLRREVLRRGADAVAPEHAVASLAEQQGQRAPRRRLVVHDQQVRHAQAASRGNNSVTRVPWPGAESISIRPPCAATMRSAIVRPSPLPFGLPE